MLKKSVYFILSLIILFLILIILFFLYQASIWVKENNTVAIPIITAIIGLIGVMWTQWQSKSRDSDVDLQAKFEKLNRGFILWASDEVIQTWIEFRKNSSENTLDKIDNVYRAIRKDLGHKDKKLKNLDLIRINLSNPNEL